MKENYRTLHICAQIEAKAAEMYSYFSRIHGDDPVAAKLWKKTAEEEENHRLQFQLATKLGNAIVGQVVVEQEKADAALRMVEMLYDSVVESPPDVTHALRFAIDIEEALVVFHMENAVEYADPACKKLFDAMAANDRDHVKSLKDYLEEVVRRTS